MGFITMQLQHNKGDHLSTQQASLSKQDEINLLMTQYSDQTLAKTKRLEVKAKLKVLMDEYNEMVLPLALKAMEEKGQG
jgi:hypothetical protein